MLFKGTQEKIRLKTMKGKIAYKITKFQLIANLPGTSDYEFVAKVTKIKDNSITGDVDFTNSEFMAVAYLKGKGSAGDDGSTNKIIFDHEMTKQCIFLTISDNDATGSDNCHCYSELARFEIGD